MAQDPRSPRTRRSRQIARLSHHGLMAEKRERHRFLRFAVEKHLIEQHECARLDLRRQPLDERRILRPAAGDHNFSSAALPAPCSLLPAPSLYRPPNRLRGQRRRRRDRIVVRTTRLLHACEQLVGVIDPEALTTGALGRWLREIRIGEQLLEQLRNGPAVARALPILVAGRIWIDAARNRRDRKRVV